jgi:hypothetical protein
MVPLAEVLFGTREQGYKPPTMVNDEIGQQPYQLPPNQFRCMLSVLGVQPGNLYELCQLYCSKCSQNFSFKTLQ